MKGTAAVTSIEDPEQGFPGQGANLGQHHGMGAGTKTSMAKAWINRLVKR